MKYSLLSITALVGLNCAFALNMCPLPSYKAVYSIYSGRTHIGNHREDLNYVNNRKYLLNGSSYFRIMVQTDRLHSTSIGNYSKNSFQPNFFHFTETSKGKKVSLAIKPGKQDEFSINLAMRNEVIHHPHIDHFNLTLQKTNKKLNVITFNLISRLKKVYIPHHGYMMVKTLFSHDPNHQPTKYLLAKKFDYLPVLIIKNKDGKILKNELFQYTKTKSKGCINP